MLSVVVAAVVDDDDDDSVMVDICIIRIKDIGCLRRVNRRWVSG